MNHPVSAIIIDDELHARDNLTALLSAYLPQVKVVASLDNAMAGLEEIVRQNPDIVFLDIHMPDYDGFWLAERLRRLKKGNKIVFITAYDKLAIDAFKYAAFDFLTKPVDPEMLKGVIIRYQEEGKENAVQKNLEDLLSFVNKNRLKLNTHDGFIIVSVNDIVYCKADRNYSEINMACGEKHLVSSPLLDLEEMLKPFGFIRISRSYLINLDYLKRFYRCSKQVLLCSDVLNVTLKASSSGVKRLMEV